MNAIFKMDQELLDLVIKEVEYGAHKFWGFNSTHEFYAVLQEEVDELWDTIKKDRMDLTELVQVIAVAFRALHEFSKKQE